MSGFVLLKEWSHVGLLGFCWLVVAFTIGCDRPNGNNSNLNPGETGSALRVSTAAIESDDVEMMRYEIQKVDCDDGSPDGDPIVEIRPREESGFPWGSGLAGAPLDEGSAHSFFDVFVTVEPGCYDVEATPLGADGAPSSICAAAWKQGVVVEEGETTEVLLINQCEGEDSGAIDVIAVLNHEPAIDGIRFEDSKFLLGLTTQICVEAHDVDGDPLEIELVPPDPCHVIAIGSPEGDPTEGVEQCFELTCEESGQKELQARVYDLVWRDGEQIRIEDWLALEGYPNDSHAALEFHVYLYDPREDMTEPALVVSQSNAQQFNAAVVFPTSALVEITEGDRTWTRIETAGVEAASGGNGRPEVPVTRHLVALPPGAVPRMLASRFETAETFRSIVLYPFQSLWGEMIPRGDPTGGEDEDATLQFDYPPFFVDEEAYNQNRWFPEEACHVDNYGTFRDMNWAVVECPAGRYNPVRQTLELFGQVEFELSFEGDEEAIPGPRSPFDTRTQLLLDMAVNRDVVTPSDFKVDDWICTGEELLILTHPDYVEAASALTDWKRAKGITTNYIVVNDGSSGPAPDTNDDIQELVKQRYDTCFVRPSYLLLLGDALQVVPTGDPTCDDLHMAAAGDIPAFYQERAYKEGHCYATDFPYGQMHGDLTDDWSIWIADIAVGRLAVGSAAEAEELVAKIIRYEAEAPLLAGPYYGRATLASYFECCQESSGPDGREYGRSSFIRRSEKLRTQLLSQGIGVDRIYNTNTGHHPDYTGDPTPRYYANGDTMPWPLRPEDGYAWDGDSFDIADTINEGRLLVIHNDHGASWGWGDPHFTRSDLSMLSNGNALPLMLSMNCSSGAYDLSATTQGFAESAVRMPEHGALGVLAFSRGSNSGVGPWTAAGAIDAIWPNQKFRLGDILTHAQAHLGSLMSEPDELWTYVRILGLFGDPTAELWTESPLQAIDINEYEIGPEGPEIYFSVEGALATVWQETADGVRPLGRAPVLDGVARVSYLQQPLAGVPLNISISAPGMISPEPLVIQGAK